jgi:hypothetical protein
MNKFILSLSFMSLLPGLAFAEFKEVSDSEIKNNFLTLVKDTEVEARLNETSEFTSCRDQNKFDPKNTDDSKLALATKCFETSLSKKSPEELKKLADNLQLESYGLIKSKNTKDITSYLTGKLTKALTGRDPNEKDPQKIKEQLKFKNQTFVDHKVFVELYVNQLGKSALQEVSRFCFENLRNKSNPTSDNFYDHWTENKYSLPPAEDIQNLSDTGEPRFEVLSGGANIDMSKKEDVFNEMIQGITKTNIDKDFMEKFFGICQSAIRPLCNKFKTSSDVNSDKSITIPTTVNSTKMHDGANACLTMNRLQSIRSAISKTKIVIESMEKLSADDQKTAINIMLEDPVKLYQQGEGKGEKTLDELTSIGSTDLLENQDQSYLDEVDKCSQDGSTSSCSENVGKKEDLDKVLYSIEMDTNLKREIEKARVKKLSQDTDKKKLREYLEENGYLQLLKDDPDLKNEALIIQAVEQNFNAKKVATIEALRNKMGKRQASDDTSAEEKKDIAQGVAKETKEERARLAQVVLFNNIITSHLTLYKKDGSGKREKVARNVNAWKKEQDALNSNSNFNQDYFSGISDMVKAEDTSQLKNTSIIDVGIIDIILGKDPEKDSN